MPPFEDAAASLAVQNMSSSSVTADHDRDEAVPVLLLYT